MYSLMYKTTVIWPADARYDQEKPDGEEVSNYILDDVRQRSLQRFPCI